MTRQIKSFSSVLSGVAGLSWVLTVACSDTTDPPPPPPDDSIAAVVVLWDQSPAPDVAVYRIHIGENPGSYTRFELVTAPGDSLSLIDLNRGQSWYFAVTAIDSTGNESILSEEISVDLSN